VHEIGIASSILECVQTAAQRHLGSRLLAVGVRIGALSNVDKDALDFAFEALARDTDLQDLRFEIEWIPWRQRCLACSAEYEVQNMDVTCPKCGTTHSTCIGGTELDVAYLELEEPSCANS
jgi:hydrogenase nickel incorporation protein HypA/HybF